jgi:hypothetical protein
MNRSIAVVTLVLGSCILRAVPSRADLITFDTYPSAGSPELVSLNTEGYTFTSSHFHVLDGYNADIVRNNSPNHIGHEGGSLGRAITMVRNDGLPFRLVGLDIAELWITGREFPEFPNASHVGVSGSLNGGGVISQSFALDGLASGNPVAGNFQNVVLGPGWTNLVSVTFNGLKSNLPNYAFAIDNIETTIPEPSSFVLLASIGLAMLLSRRATK